MIARIRRHLAADQGFTLPELLITTVIMGVIVGAIGAALITALRLYSQPSQKLGPSNDANLIANYFSADVQSTTANDRSPTDSGCAYATPAGTVNVIRLSWTDNAPTPSVDKMVAYQFNSTANTLTRVACTKGGAASVSTIGRNILSAQVTYVQLESSYELSLTARDPEAPTADAPFAFSFRAYQRNAGSDNGGGGSSSGPAKLPPGAAIGTLTAFSDLGGTSLLGPLPGVAVTLSNATFSATRTTGDNGKFYIGTVPAGTYTLSISPANYIATTNSPTPLSSSVTIGTAELTSNFSIVRIGSIAGLVRTGPATPVPGATVTLSGPVNTFAVTGALGTYSFPNLPDGSYSVIVTPPAGYNVGAGPHCGPTAINGNAVTCPDVVLTQATYTITGVVRTPANTPLGSVVVNLNGSSIASTTTNGSGQYSFTVFDGTYTVTAAAPAGYTPALATTCNNVATNLADQTCPDAVFTPPVGGTISGFVRRDLDGDGTGDIEMPGIPVQLSTGATTTSLSDGSFSFVVPTDGSFTVTHSPISGFTSITGLSANVTVTGGISVPTPVSFVNRWTACWLVSSANQPVNTVNVNRSGKPANNQSVAAKTNTACPDPVEIRFAAAPVGSPGPPSALPLTTTYAPLTSTYTSAIPTSPNWNTATGSTTASVYSGSMFLGTIQVRVQ